MENPVHKLIPGNTYKFASVVLAALDPTAPDDTTPGAGLSIQLFMTDAPLAETDDLSTVGFLRVNATEQGTYTDPETQEIYAKYLSTVNGVANFAPLAHRRGQQVYIYTTDGVDILRAAVGYVEALAPPRVTLG